MDALVMCGGQGRRLDASVEKPLFEIAGEPMLDRVLAALTGSQIETVSAAVTQHVPDTRTHLESEGVSTIETPGEGYVADLNHAIERVDEPVLTVASDLPLLAPDAIDRIIDDHDSGSMTVAVPATIKRLLDLSIDTTLDDEGTSLAPTGVNVVSSSGEETTYVTYDVRFAVNVNRQRDATVAEALA